jgi:DNA-directed RNA polymerase specialized sigma24 family protein
MTDSPKADDARDDFILQERLSGRSARSISKELHCTTADVDASLDRTLPKITNEAKRRIIALDLDRLDELLKVFFTRAVEKVDAQAGLLVVKILERKAAMLGLDSPQKLDVVQVQAQKEPTQHERIRDAIMRVANSAPPAQRAVIKKMEELGPEKVLELINAGKSNGSSAPSDQTH